MAYVDPNFKSKKALKEAVAAGQEVTVFQPGGMFPLTLRPISDTEGTCAVEGPHYPKPHSWYAEVVVNLQTHVVTKVK